MYKKLKKKKMDANQIKSLTIGDVYGLSKPEIEILLLTMNPQSREDLESNGWKLKYQNKNQLTFTKRSSIWGS